MNDIDLLNPHARMSLFAALVISIVAIVLFVVFYIDYRRQISKLRARIYASKDEILTVDVAYFHEIGKRESQQDSYYISPLEDYRKTGLVAMVADGMGGLKYGDEISKSVVNKLEEMYPLSFHASEHNADEFRAFSNQVYDEYRVQGGSTLAMVHIFGNYMHFYSAGDSDIILIRDGESTIINPRQKYANSIVKKLAKSGHTTYEAYVDKESRALVDFIGNSNPRIIYTSKPIRLLANDTIIVSSDGLTDVINWKTLGQYVSRNAYKTAENLKRNIVLKKHPRQDNYTGIVINLSRDGV